MTELRGYQKTLLDDITTAAASGARKILVTAPVGSGKTVLFADIVRHATSTGKRSLIACHRRELIEQARVKMAAHGIECGIILADYPNDPTLPVQIGSIQSLYAKGIRRKKIMLPQADVVIPDEAHRSMSDTWQKLLENYGQAFIVGFTATPIRKDGKGLGHFWDVLVKGPTVKDLIATGDLVDVRIFAPSLPDLQGVRVVAGDYVEDQLAERMDQPKLIGDIVQNWVRRAQGKKTIVFATGVKHSVHLAEAFAGIGVKAAHIDGGTDAEERDRIVKDFREGDLTVLTNCAVVEEGADFPRAEALVFARPTKSLRLYLQIVGRVMRPAPGKSDGLLLDHAGVVYEHGRPTDDWDWKLDYGAAKTVKAAAKKKLVEQEARRITCGECALVYEGQLACPLCGWRPKPKGKHVETYEAYLVELLKSDEKAYRPDERKWYLMLLGYARKKGWKDGWAAHKYNEKFKKWPGSAWKSLEPQEPDAEVRAYIQHLNIKAAYRREKQRTIDGALIDAWKAKRPPPAVQPHVASHGLARKEALGGDAYAPEAPEFDQ